MSTGQETTLSTTDREITTTRLVDAPRELVFDAFTQPEHVARWWGPNGFTNTIHVMDVRPGGEWRFVMHGPDGTDYPNKHIFREIVRPERIVMSHVSGPMFTMTVTLENQGGKTLVTMHALFETEADYSLAVNRFGAIEGARQNMARLAEYMTTMAASAPSSHDIVVTRTLDAPRALVFEAWTRPEHLVRWWAPRDCTTPFFKVDPKVGGKFHYCIRTPDGMEVHGIGTYREVKAPERLSFTDAFADDEGNPVSPTHYGASASYPAETLVTVLFDEVGGRTRLTLRQSFPEPAADRDSTQQGWNDMLDRLAGTLAVQSGGAA
jgi:uncharacterized protein YndB with AHSA1/START domain